MKKFLAQNLKEIQMNKKSINDSNPSEKMEASETQ